ncbi:MAG: metallophosphoesterase family protein [Firmicutes bacterium]|nr:metallophosphoesterase family protein [Bacillota bacterium]
MIYFTSDVHLGHKNIISHCDRPFSSLEEMDQHLISYWNRRISADDTVYILGDLMFFCKDPQWYLERLNGRKHLIRGNHDSAWFHTMAKRRAKGVEGAREASDFFQSVQDLLELKLDGTRLVLCHYPMMSWNHLEAGSYLLFGHIHNSVHAPYWPLLWGMDHALNVGVDIKDFRPVTFDELLENNRRFRQLHPPQL